MVGRVLNFNARGLFKRSVVWSMLGVGSNDWAHFTGKHLHFPNVFFVCQACTQILWNYVMFEVKNGHFSVVYSWCYIFMVLPNTIHERTKNICWENFALMYISLYIDVHYMFNFEARVLG
jgi:hypothetical protein